MPQAQNTLTPIDAVLEERLVSFDYGLELTTGTVVTGVLDLTCTVVTGVDPNAQDRILSAPAIVDAAPLPFGTGVADAAVSVMIGEMVAGVTYLLQCVVQTTDSQHLSVWQHQDCIEPS
jgi:hypothetical protein